MSRLRRIADQDRIFFITTNLLKDCPPLIPSERDLILSFLGDVRTRSPFILLGYVVMPTTLIFSSRFNPSRSPT